MRDYGRASLWLQNAVYSANLKIHNYDFPRQYTYSKSLGKGTMTGTQYQYFTEEVISDFEKSGSESLAQQVQDSSLDESEIENVVSTIFTEMMMVYEEGKLKVEAIINFLQLVIKEESTATIFCEVFDVFPLSTGMQSLLQAINSRQNVIKSSTIARAIRVETISQSGIVPSDILNRQLNVRKRDEFYTQKKFNLLHEESEGYAKLIVEIHDFFKKDSSMEKIDYAVETIEKIIGHYSLDPNRSLDILLEVFSNHFVSNHTLAIALLKRTRWWPIIEGDCHSSIEKLSLGGNENASKILGLKLMKYPKDKDLPETTKVMIACLIKKGFISFGSIYKYLRPSEGGMSDLEAAYKKDLEEKVLKASASALALAAPLQDESAESEESKGNGADKNIDSADSKAKKPTKNRSEGEKVDDKLRFNMKYQMLRVFLGNGLYWPSIFILSEYPFLANIHPEISDLIARLFTSMVDPLYNSIKVLDDEELTYLQDSKKIAFSRPSNSVFYDEYPCSYSLSFKPNIRSHSQRKFVFFDNSWDADLSKISSVEELFFYSKEFLKFAGVNISNDLELFCKLCEIGVWDLQNTADNDRKEEWFQFFRNFIFPAIPTIEENPIAIDKAYSLLSFYSIEDRFNLYSELHQVLAKNHPLIKIAYGKAERATKDVMKRLSKENVRPMMRRLAKISYSNPLPCLLTILQQIESYDNLNTLVVQSARYFNSYGWDNLTLAILMRLTSSGRSNMQDDGLNGRQWIQSLASFIGKISQYYPNSIDLNTLITFLLKTFHNDENFGLIILREIFTSMGGIQSINNLTIHQIEMANCGGVLEKLVHKTIGDLRFERKKSGTILAASLIKLNAVNEILVLLNQMSNRLHSSSESIHLKVLANMSDELNGVIHLLLTLVNFFCNRHELETSSVAVLQLCEDYAVSPEWAFELWRPIMAGKTDKKGAISPVIPDSDTSRLLKLKEIEVPSQLYHTFWNLSLYDINFSQELYESETEKIESTIQSLKDTLSINRKNKDVSVSTINSYKKDLETYEEFLKSIVSDKAAHSNHNSKIREDLCEQSLNWFDREDKVISFQSFIQYCILPRSVHSSFDAVFSSMFLFKLHDLKTKNFSLPSVLNEFFNKNMIFGTLFTLTSTEAENLGLFLSYMFRRLNEWAKQEVFETELAQNPLKNAEAQDVTFKEYRKMLFSFHQMLLEDISRALEVKEYMARRNAITFLKNLLGVYPTVEDHCERIVELIEKISETEERGDLKLSSNALIGHVKSRSKDWVHLWDFVELSESERDAHKEKRDEIERGKELLRVKEKQRQLESKKAEDAKMAAKKLASAPKPLNYDGNTPAQPRKNIRGSSDTPRARYDQYSGTGDIRDTNQNKPATNGASDLVSTKDSSVDNKKEEVIESTTRGEGDKKNKPADLKERLLEAKKELKKKAQERGSDEDKSTPEVETEKKPNKGQESVRQADSKTVQSVPPTANPSVKKKEDAKPPKTRAPLPPQEYAARKEFDVKPRFNDQKRKPIDSNQGRYNSQRNYSNNAPLGSQNSRLPVPPPPPISLKPQAKNESYSAPRGPQRYDNKRKNDFYGNGRGYDKKQRH